MKKFFEKLPYLLVVCFTFGLLDDLYESIVKYESHSEILRQSFNIRALINFVALAMVSLYLYLLAALEEINDKFDRQNEKKEKG